MRNVKPAKISSRLARLTEKRLAQQEDRSSKPKRLVIKQKDIPRQEERIHEQSEATSDDSDILFEPEYRSPPPPPPRSTPPTQRSNIQRYMDVGTQINTYTDIPREDRIRALETEPWLDMLAQGREISYADDVERINRNIRRVRYIENILGEMNINPRDLNQLEITAYEGYRLTAYTNDPKYLHSTLFTGVLSIHVSPTQIDPTVQFVNDRFVPLATHVGRYRFEIDRLTPHIYLIHFFRK